MNFLHRSEKPQKEQPFTARHRPTSLTPGFIPIRTEEERPIFSTEQILSPTELKRGMILMLHNINRTLPVVVLASPKFGQPPDQRYLKVRVLYLGYGNHVAEEDLCERGVVIHPEGWWPDHNFYTDTHEVMTEEELADLGL